MNEAWRKCGMFCNQGIWTTVTICKSALRPVMFILHFWCRPISNNMIRAYVFARAETAMMCNTSIIKILNITARVCNRVTVAID